MHKSISFKSAISPVTCKEYANIAARIGRKKFVSAPWTLNQSIKSDSAYTTGVFDCTLCGITDGESVLMMHLCPDVAGNHHFSRIFRYIANNMDLKNPDLQGFLLGSQMKELSADIYTKFVEFFKNYKIPFSELKIGADKLNAAYIKEKDTWIVSSLKIDKLLKQGCNSAEVMKNMFKKVSISNVDELV